MRRADRDNGRPGKQEREAAPVSPKPHQGLAGQPHALGRPLIGNQIA
jgi:hypothetical protein